MSKVAIEFAQPVTVALAPPDIRHWGPYQFPGLARMPDGRIQLSHEAAMAADGCRRHVPPGKNLS